MVGFSLCHWLRVGGGDGKGEMLGGDRGMILVSKKGEGRAEELENFVQLCSCKCTLDKGITHLYIQLFVTLPPMTAIHVIHNTTANAGSRTFTCLYEARRSTF